MQNNLLETFVTVVECGGFSDAQYALGITQSAISCRIRDLELALGYRVCQRGRSGFCLTERGQIAYEKACAMLRRVRDFDAELTELRDTITGELRIGVVDAVTSLPGFPLVAALQRFLGRKNDVRLEIVVASPTDLTQGLITGSVHVAIAPFKNKVAELSYTEVCTEGHSLYCGRQHPLFDASADAITPEILNRFPVCQRSYDTAAGPAFGSAFPKAVVANMEAMAMLILSGRYLGALPDHYAQGWVASGDLRTLDHPELSWKSEFHLAVRQSQAQRRAVELLVKDVLSSAGI
ncbi:LysR family transcriptional regulator [Nitratireductor sp. XY-223]|uniref:LysR family transcriptional regulator n=1 Tax=Nitratireductor sp. XY-223 TaxID=2561926 RepID=UPI001FEEE6F5|nr:LysR family transcriptional regulator [Nitratireductor sp. XY-223]